MPITWVGHGVHRTLILIVFGFGLSGCDQNDSQHPLNASRTVGKAITANGGVETSVNPAQVTSPFLDITARSSVNFIHNNGASGKLYMPEIMGAGGALLDADGDGDLDIYLVQGGSLAGQDTATSDVLLRNDLDYDVQGKPRIKFKNISDSAGIPKGMYGMGVATGDVDGDGNTDLYVTNFGPNRLLRGRGDGTFEDITERSGTGDEHWSVPATFFDADGDGDLDLYSGSYVDFRLENHRDCFSGTGLPDYCSPHSYSAVSDKLFRNRGDGTFDDISASSGLRSVPSKALGVISGDFNDDGHTDLYVANDGVANQLWINQADGTFVDDALFAGCAVNYEGSPEASMGVDAADVDGDGDEDIFITHLRGETNTLYLNHGDGTFEDRTIRLGLAGPSIPYTGFGTAWLDVENDGKLDLLAVNGAVTVEERLVQVNDPFPYHQPNQLFRNLSEGSTLHFEQYASSEDDPLLVSNVSRGAMFGDLDNDGDLDVVITNNSGPARILQNVVGQDNDWFGLRLRKSVNGPDALGASVTIKLADGNTMMRRVRTAGSYVSANDPRIVFGLGEPVTGSPKLEVSVQWQNGKLEDFGPFARRRYHEIIQGQGRVSNAK